MKELTLPELRTKLFAATEWLIRDLSAEASDNANRLSRHHWDKEWLGPRSVLVEYARLARGATDKDVGKRLEALLQADAGVRLASRYVEVLELEGTSLAREWQPSCCNPDFASHDAAKLHRPAEERQEEKASGVAFLEQGVTLLHGLAHGVLAAVALARWRETGETEAEFVDQAMKCATAYQQAWELGGEKRVPAVAPELLHSGVLGRPVDDGLSLLQNHASHFHDDGLLVLCRLLEYVLHDARVQSHFAVA